MKLTAAGITGLLLAGFAVGALVCAVLALVLRKRTYASRHIRPHRQPALSALDQALGRAEAQPEDGSEDEGSERTMAEMPRLIRPMTATLRCSLPADQDRYGWEFKWDGVRAIAYVSGGEVRLVSRRTRTWRRATRSWPCSPIASTPR